MIRELKISEWTDTSMYQLGVTLDKDGKIESDSLTFTIAEDTVSVWNNDEYVRDFISLIISGNFSGEKYDQFIIDGGCSTDNAALLSLFVEAKKLNIW